jgi:hypothetical protein
MGGRERYAMQLALALLVGILLYLGLTPFDFSPPNRVRWITGAPGLHFDSKGIAVSEAPLRWSDSNDGGITIRLAVVPASDLARGLGTLVSFEDGMRPQPLVVGQWKHHLIIRVRSANGAGRGYWELGVPKALIEAEPALITIRSSRSEGTRVDVGGETTKLSTRSLLSDHSPFAGTLVLGSASDGSSSWEGEMRGLAIYTKALEDEELAIDRARIQASGFEALEPHPVLIAQHAFREGSGVRVANLAGSPALPSLRIPEAFDPPAPNVFSLPLRSDLGQGWFLLDLYRNLLGFVPLGLLGHLIQRLKGASVLRASAAAMALGASVSLVIETVQVFIPVRNSSLTDLSLNVLGALLGASLGALIVRLGWIGAQAGPAEPGGAERGS